MYTIQTYTPVLIVGEDVRVEDSTLTLNYDAARRPALFPCIQTVYVIPDTEIYIDPCENLRWLILISTLITRAESEFPAIISFAVEKFPNQLSFTK